MPRLLAVGVFFDERVGVVIVDRLEILGLCAIPQDIRIRFAAQSNVAHEVLHENRIVVGLLGHVFFVRSFEKAE
jgi:hypothetical protein